MISIVSSGDDSEVVSSFSRQTKKILQMTEKQTDITLSSMDLLAMNFPSQTREYKLSRAEFV